MTSPTNTLSAADWVRLASDAASCDELCRVTRLWYLVIRDSRQLAQAIGFEACMQRGDVAGAKGSVIRSYGQSGGAHADIVRFLDAAIQSGRFMECRSSRVRERQSRTIGEVP